jgi:hypothetical protein
MLKVLTVVVLGVVAMFLAARIYGASRWSAGTQSLRSALDAARAPLVSRTVDFAELEGLPAPVQRYFRSVLTDHSPLIAGVRLRHRGRFNMSETAEQWKAFTSDQQVVTRRPGFDWDGRIQMLPGVPVHVHDAYVAGEGVLHAALLGAITLANLRGGGDIARGELMRYLAESAWYPTALLPSQGVRWSAIDDRSASATLEDGPVSVTLRFTFLPEGPIDTVDADARPRMVGGALVQSPWHGRFWNYEEHEGVRVPVDGEVSWLLPEGARPYWRGHATQISFTFAP